MMTIVSQQARHDTATTSSTATIDNSRPASPGIGKSNRVLSKEIEGTLPEFTYACTPSRSQRYALNRTVKYKEPSCDINPSSILFPPDPELPLPLDWVQHIHPEGLPYFVLSLPGNGPMRRIVTEEWMYDPKISQLVLDFVDLIKNAISELGVNGIWPGSDLFLELERSVQGEFAEDKDGHKYCGYYFVYSPNRCIYWPERVTLKRFTSKFLNGTWGDLSQSQKQLCLEAEYWTHWNHFPSLYEVTPDITNYVVSTIVDVMTDVISAPHNSSSIFSYEELQKMLNLVRITKDCNTSTWYIGRFMMRLTQDRLRNYYGVWGARLQRSQSVVEVEHESHSAFVDIVSPFLFFIPHAQLERAATVAVDRYIVSPLWESFLNEIQEEWNQTSVLATITLAANCAFLAIPLFQDPALATHSSPEQIASYLSTTTSLFGLVLSLTFYRHHKTRRTSLPAELFAYIHETEQEYIDCRRFEHLLLVWSLPHAFVMWSAVTFSLAFIFMCLCGTLTATKVAVGLTMLSLGLATFFCIIKFGSGKNLFRIWLNRSYQSMKRMKRLFSLCNQLQEHQNQSVLATLPR